jgi:hypothetical protein
MVGGDAMDSITKGLNMALKVISVVTGTHKSSDLSIDPRDFHQSLYGHIHLVVTVITRGSRYRSRGVDLFILCVGVIGCTAIPSDFKPDPMATWDLVTDAYAVPRNLVSMTLRF